MYYFIFVLRLIESYRSHSALLKKVSRDTQTAFQVSLVHFKKHNKESHHSPSVGSSNVFEFLIIDDFFLFDRFFVRLLMQRMPLLQAFSACSLLVALVSVQMLVNKQHKLLKGCSRSASRISPLTPLPLRRLTERDMTWGFLLSDH